MSSMQRYMEHLIDDIRESAKNKDENIQYVPPVLYNLPKHLEHLPVIPQRKSYEWFKLSPEAFPEAEKWDDYQLLYMCVILRSLFEHYNINVELSNDLPYETVYAFLLKALDTYTTAEPDASNQISFCSGDEGNCPFGDYCARQEQGYCDTWNIGQHWDGFIILAEMEKDRKAQGEE